MEYWGIVLDEENREKQYYSHYENDQLVHINQAFMKEGGKEGVMMKKAWKNCSIVIQSIWEDIKLAKRVTTLFDMVLVMRLMNQMEFVFVFAMVDDEEIEEIRMSVIETRKYHFVLN